MDIALARDFQDFLKSLRSHGVEYLLIGGYAVGFYGYPRFTGDMDIWLRQTPENVARVIGALKEFGFTEGVSPDLFAEPGSMVRVGAWPNLLEIITSISGAEFDECYLRRATVDVNGIPVDVIGYDDLLVNKRASGRLKDLADLEMLEKNKKKKK